MNQSNISYPVINELDEHLELLQPCKKVEMDNDEHMLENKRQRTLGESTFSRLTTRLTTTRWSKLLPSPVQHLVSPTDRLGHAPRTTAWLDGIRGCAALVVFFEHMSLSVQDSHSMVRAYGSPGATSFWQLPIVRLLYDGTPMVPIFYVTSGCALSLKPLSHIQKREWQDFGATISSATFRRAFRLFLPSAAVSFLAMIFTQVGIYHHPYPFMKGNAIQIDRPQRLPNIAAQYVDWLNWVVTQLLYSDELFQPLSKATISNYGFQLWTISTEFYASIALFITLVGLARLIVSIRQLLILCLCSFAFYVERWDVACFMAGVSIAELFIQTKLPSYVPQETVSLPIYNYGKYASSWLPASRQYAFWLLFITGLFIASYPGKQASENFIYRPFSAIINSVRFWESIGAMSILLSTSQLHLMQRLFTSAVPRYLGRISYGIYLTHVLFLNVFGWRVVPWVWKVIGNEGWWGYQGGFAVGLIVCLLLLIWIADLWTRVVDEPCVRFAKRVENWATSY
jgi:peptidoglycan/LPS O-acetylase OafA/YrhL